MLGSSQDSGLPGQNFFQQLAPVADPPGGALVAPFCLLGGLGGGGGVVVGVGSSRWASATERLRLEGSLSCVGPPLLGHPLAKFSQAAAKPGGTVNPKSPLVWGSICINFKIWDLKLIKIIFRPKIKKKKAHSGYPLTPPPPRGESRTQHKRHKCG